MHLRLNSLSVVIRPCIFALEEVINSATRSGGLTHKDRSAIVRAWEALSQLRNCSQGWVDFVYLRGIRFGRRYGIQGRL